MTHNSNKVRENEDTLKVDYKYCFWNDTDSVYWKSSKSVPV